MNPALIVSLDFELRWGLLGVLGDDMNEYRENLEGVEEVVPRLLEMFRDRAVRATWATVGALACRDWEEWHRGHRRIRSTRIRYSLGGTRMSDWIHAVEFTSRRTSLTRSSALAVRSRLTHLWTCIFS